MKNRAYLLFVVITCCICFATQSFGASLLSKGKEYVDARMWDRAIETLNKVIDSDPKNAEAHYLLGYSYGKQGNSYLSNERYKSAVILSLENGMVNKALLKMNTAQLISTRKVFDEVIEKDRHSEKKLASQIFNYGERRLKEKEYNEGWLLVSFAISYDHDLTYRACDTAYKLGTISDEATVEYSTQLSAYCGNNKKRMTEIGERILRVAASIPKGEYRSNLKQKALWFLSQERVDEVIPPPIWKTVFSQEYVGQGYGENDYVLTAVQNQDTRLGDKIIITSLDFHGAQTFNT